MNDRAILPDGKEILFGEPCLALIEGNSGRKYTGGKRWQRVILTGCLDKKFRDIFIVDKNGETYNVSVYNLKVINGKKSQ